MSKYFGLWIAFVFFHPVAIEGQISCYQCNIDSSLGGFSNDCTDPYVPSPLHHLLPCPEDEPHHCLKAEILYNNNDVTVRACVPSRVLSEYCDLANFDESFPGAEVRCLFCEEHACNRSAHSHKPLGILALVLFVLVATNSQGVLIG